MMRIWGLIIFASFALLWPYYGHASYDPRAKQAKVLGQDSGAPAEAIYVDNGGILLTSKSVLNTEFVDNPAAATVDVDWTNGNRQVITLDQNLSVRFNNPDSGVGTFSLMLVQDGSGSRTISSWVVQGAGNVRWPGGNTPTLSTAPSAVDIVSCVYNGVDYYCQYGLDFQ